ncbi:hypothetical protein I3U44_24195 [Mycobacteroides abscessus subsp. bolletii]|nr:hypothetical protein I3U44_24195 [Mycobacteroides abscessus subsp. bolletii]
MTQGTALLDAIEHEVNLVRAQQAVYRLQQNEIETWINNPDGSAGAQFLASISDQAVIKQSWPQRKNISSQGYIELPTDHAVARYAMGLPNNPVAKKNLLISISRYNGKWRWSGLLRYWKLQRRNGIYSFVIYFNDDLQYLQYLLVPPNPALPLPVFQFPREFFLYAPLKWAISMTMLMQFIRVEGHPWTLPDDPFDLKQWTSLIDWAQWQCHVKADPFLLDDSSLWGCISSRMNAADVTFADALDDGQMVIGYRRVFTIKGEKYDGLLTPSVANGALVFEVFDRSGFYLPGGTFLSGTIAEGFIRTAVTYVNGYYEDAFTVVGDNESLTPDQYYQSGFMGTFATRPWICINDDQWHDFDSELSWSPAGPVSVVVGGDNPTADAIARLIIESVGDMIGYFLLGGFASAGDIAADVIMPFLVGTIAAWLEWKNIGRTRELGWMHLMEMYQSGAENNAWSLSATAAIRGAFTSTRAQTGHQIKLDGSHWVIPGLHFEIGDRIGSTHSELLKNGIDVMFADQVEEMVLAGDNSAGQPLTWDVTIGLNKAAMTQGERTARTLKKVLATVQNIGVHLIS